MDRKYYVCNNLDELELTQQELVQRGFSDTQLQVLSHDEAGVRQHHLHEVGTFSKTDIVHSTLRGAVIGIIGSALALLLPYLLGMTADMGWTPFVLMAIIALGISTWEGGLWGIQEINWHFRAFEPLLDRGAHVLIVDIARLHEDELDFEIAETQEDVLREVASHHPLMQAA